MATRMRIALGRSLNGLLGADRNVSSLSFWFDCFTSWPWSFLDFYVAEASKRVARAEMCAVGRWGGRRG
jgi:hypothetical protein